MSQEALEKSIFGDMSNLEKSLADDHSGDHARTIIKYFRTIVEATQRMLSGSKEESQRHLLSRLLRGFEAAERIVRHVWETVHGTALVV